MNKHTALTLLGGIALGIVISFLFASNAFSYRYGGMMGMMGYRPNSSQFNQVIDQRFIEQMIPHHEDAITMANVALEKAEHPEIKTLAQSIAKAQTNEVNEMRAWYSQWYGVTVPQVRQGTMGMGSSHMGMMGGQTNTAYLQSAKPFDKAFIEAMIPHHQMAIMMANMLEGSTNRPEMRQLAQNIIQTQTSEIEQMQTWYNQWYHE